MKEEFNRNPASIPDIHTFLNERFLIRHDIYIIHKTVGNIHGNPKNKKSIITIPRSMYTVNKVSTTRRLSAKCETNIIQVIK